MAPHTDAASVLGLILLPLAFPLVLLAPASRSFVWAYTPQAIKDASAGYLAFDDQLPGLLAAVGMLIFAAWVTALGIKLTMEPFRERGFVGRDLLKPKATVAIPEMMGLPSACLYILLLFLFIPCRYRVIPPVELSPLQLADRKEAIARALGFGASTAGGETGAQYLHKEGLVEESSAAILRMDFDGGWNGLMSGRGDFPHHELATFLSALLSLLSAIMLGFLDDVFDIRWRYKIPIPIISSVPLLVVYYAGGGGTHVVVPSLLRPFLPDRLALFDLGALYYVYISCLSTFCTNSINILAGINGVEVGQALIIALSLAANDCLYLDTRAGQSGSRSSIELVQRHLFSLYLLLPFIGTCLGLLYWNRFPSRVFVGDTFCYFAGQVLAVVGILGHFSKTLLLFFLPQLFNFLLSCPQLFGFVPCPRHRLPKIHPETMQLYPSSAAWSEGHQASFTSKCMLLLLEALHFTRLSRDSNGRIIGCTNLTILNAILVLRGVRGPMDQPGDTSLGKKVRTSSSARTPTATVFPAASNGSASAEKAIQLAPPPAAGAGTARPVEIKVDGPAIDELSLWRHVIAVQCIGSLFAFSVRYYIAALLFPQR